MVQKLLIMERDTKEELQEAINKNILEADNNSRISAISVLEQSPDKDHIAPYFEVWMILEVPENKDRLYRSLRVEDAKNRGV